MAQKPPLTYGAVISNTTQTINLLGMGVQLAKATLQKKKQIYPTPPLENTDPMEGMAAGEELSQYQYRAGAFYLGNIHPEHGHNFEAGVFDDRHIFIVAGNAGGKGRSLIIQNAIRWKGGAVFLDPKGELASITAMRRGTAEAAMGSGTSVRKFIGQQVAVLDPYGETEGAARCYQVRYNPLSDINIKCEDAQGQIKKIASACIIPEEGKNSHFSENAETILAGAIEAVLLTYPEDKHNLAFVRQMLLNSFDDLLDILQDIKPKSQLREFTKVVDGKKKLFREVQKPRGRIPVNGLAAEAVGMLADVIGTDEAGSFKTTLSRNLKWLSEPQIQRHVATSDVSLKSIVQSGGTVYIVVPPNRIDDLKSWLRIITQTAINAKISLGVNQRTQPTLFMLDEFPLLGNFKEIEKSAGFLRGYNCKIACAIQNIGQIKQHYTKNWETFLGNAGAIIGFATNDHETEEYLSKRMGKILAWETSYSINSGTSSQMMSGSSVSDGKTTTQAQRERGVRLSNEIHQQASRETMKAFVIPADGKPFSIQRQNYDDIPTQGIYDSPQFCIQWEQTHRGRLT